MAFLNTIFLFALAAAAVPLLIHLLNRQKIKIISFSSLEFLKLLQRQKMRRVKLRQLILLLLRTLIVLSVVLAFARPVLKGVFSAGLSARARTSAVLLLDNSFSMGVNTPRGTLFDIARGRAQEVVGLLRNGDETWVHLVSDVSAFQQYTQNFTELRETIESFDLSNRTTHMRSALISATEVLAQSRNANKEVYLITDMRRNGWQDLAQGEAVPFVEDATLFVLPVSSGQTENISIDGVAFLDRLLEVGKPVGLRAVVTNHSDRKRENILVQLFTNGKRMGQTTLDIEAHRTQNADFVVVFDKPGQISGYVEVEDDDLLVDNREYFSIAVPEKIRVLIVGRREADAHYLRLALNPFETSQSLVLPTVSSVDQLGRYALGDFDVVLLTNVPRLSEAQRSRLQSYVEGGRSVVILLGNDIDPRYYNSQLLPTLFPSTIGAPLGTLGEKSSFLTFGQIESEHPIFKGLLQKRETIESPEFYLIYDVKPSAVVIPIISYSNGKVALAETRTGRGRTVLFTSAADPQWTNLMRKGIYVPLLYRVVQYLATDLSEIEEHNLVGTVVRKEVGGLEFHQRVRCIEPTGEERAIELKSSGGSFFVEYEHTESPGIYRLVTEHEDLKNFAVNADPSESDMTRIEMDRIEEALQGVSVHNVDQEESVEEYVLRTRYGRELWKQFLLVAFLLMCAEMLIAREKRRDDGVEES
ncbi:MAG: BatA domain-containing protein [Gemmatimonadota bacterium]|nr:MAG: BatA domain-containing protein [Gemmatimonadota bacterium]